MKKGLCFFYILQEKLAFGPFTSIYDQNNASFSFQDYERFDFYKRAAIIKYKDSTHFLYFIILMSDSDQFNPFASGRMMRETALIETNAFIQRCLPLKEVLECPPDQIFTAIQKLSLLPEAERKLIQREHSISYMTITKKIIEQLKKVTNWSIDHDKLFKEFTSISQFMDIEVKIIYKMIILDKIQNGLTFIETYAKFSKPSMRMDGPSLPEKNMIQVFQNCYKVTRNDVHKEDPDYALYNKRFNCLNNEQKVKYQLKLLKQLMAIPSMPNMPHFDPMNPAPLMLFSASQSKAECLGDIEKFYQQLEKIEYDWYFGQLLEIDCPKTTEYKKIIASLSLIQQEGEEKQVSLARSPKIKPTLITQSILNKCCLAQKQKQSNILSQGSILFSNSKVYLKYDITELLNISFEHLGFAIKINRGGGVENINIDEESLKKNLSHTIQMVYLLIKQASDQNPIYFYENTSNFKQIPVEKMLLVTQFCLTIIRKAIEFGTISKKMNIVSEILAKPELTIHFSMVQALLLKKTDMEKHRELFFSICRSLEELVMKNQGKMIIMRNEDFLNLFIENVNRIVEDEKQKYIHSQLQSFLINYIPKLFQYGLPIQKLNLTKIYELELATLSANRPKRPRRYIRGRHAFDRFDPEQAFGEQGFGKRDKLQQFIEAFPGCVSYFSEKLSTSAESIQQQLVNIDVFNGSAPQLQCLLKLFVNQKITSNQGLSTVFKKLLHQHPSIFVKESKSANFTALKNKLDVKGEEINDLLLSVHAKLKQGVAVESIPAPQLCQKETTSNQEMIDLSNMINHLNLLLKMRTKNPTFPHIKELLEISLIMEKIESVALNKIVNYQASYTEQQLKAINEYYKEIGDRKILYFTLAEDLKLLSQTCWQVFDDLDLPHINILLKEFGLYFETMKDSRDRNLVLRIMKKTYRNLHELAQKHRLNLNFQLYHHNRDLIFEALSIIYKQIEESKKTSRETAVMGSSYLRFVQKCRRNNKDAVSQFNLIIVPHLQESVSELIDFLFFKVRFSRSIFNFREYRGEHNTIDLIRSICCDVVTRISKNFDISYLAFYSNFIKYVETRPLFPLDGQTQETKTLQIQQPTNLLLPVTKELKQKIFIEAYGHILDKIKEYRYQKSKINNLQAMFLRIIEKLYQKYNVPNQQHKLLTTILQEISENSQNNELIDQVFKIQCSWIDNIIGKVKNFKFENLVSIGFINNYRKLISLMLNNPEQYKESIPNSIVILEKFMPKNYNENKTELIKYAINLLELITKVISCSISFKKVNHPSLFNIASALIQSKCSQFTEYIQRFLNILINQNTNIGPLLSELIEKESQLPSMEADIKGLFLRQSQNLVDESQDKISIRLTTFINIFKYKYSEDVAAFSNLTSKFVKKSIRNDDKKEIVYLSYEKSSNFSYSEVLKKDFNQFQPSEHIKAIIKNLLNFKSKQTLKIRLESLRDLVYYSPLLIPYVMLHPIETQSETLQFIDFLVSKISSNKSEAILNFLLFACLDHSCMVRLKDRTIFFSEYLCYRIIKQITKSGINKFTLVLIYSLCQLKRFTFLCKLKLNNNDKLSLVDVMIKHLKSSRQGFLYKNAQNNIIYLIMAIIFKQDAVDNLKKCFIPKKYKQIDRQYKIINESLIPFNVYFRKLKDGRLQSRQENIAFTGNLITPFYPQINEDIYLDEEYKYIEKAKYQLQVSNQAQKDHEEYIENLQPQFLKALASVPSIKKYQNASRQIKTQLNERHQNMVSQICKVYLKGQNSLQNNNPQIERQEEQMVMRQGIFRREGRGTRTQFERWGGRGGGRGGRGRAGGRFDRDPSRRNRPHISRYAQEDFSPNRTVERGQKKTLQKEFQQSLNIIPSQEIIQEENSCSNFEDIKTGQEELQLILRQVNEKLFLLGQDQLKLHDLKGETFAQKKSFLELKDIQFDFDYHKGIFQPEQFEQYCLMNSHRFEKLDPTRRQSLRQAEETMYLFNLKRSYSSDSIGHIIDTIDVNYQYLNISRTLSRSESLSSDGENAEQLPQENFIFESKEIPLRAFTDIQEETLYEMLLSFYYVCDTFASKSFMPFLQNKKSQVKLINSLLQVMKNPFNNKYFPNCIYRLSANDLMWRQVPITQSNLKQEHERFNERVLMTFQSVKNYSFHQDDNFLLTQIGNEGIFDIKYEAITRKAEENTYIPIYELLQYGFGSQTKQNIINLLKGVKKLPQNKIDQMLVILQNSQVLAETSQQQHAFVMGRVYQIPKRQQNLFPYENLKQIFKGEAFHAKFKQVYIFGTKDPSSALLVHLIQSGIYSKQELQTFQLKFLASKQEDPRTLNFLNKVIDIYTDEQLKQAKWIKQYRQTIAKVLDYLNRSSVQFDKQPISRILKLTNDLGFEIKKAIFVRQITQRKRGINIDYDQIEKRQVTAKLQKGIFESAFEDLRNKPDNFWISPFSIKFVSEHGKQQSGFGDGVKREWFTLLSKAMVNLNYALFKRTKNNNYFFNHESEINPRHLQYFQFIGKLVGFSLSKGSVFVSPSLSLIIYKMMLGEEVTIEDVMEDFDEQKKGITSIQNMIEDIKTKEDFDDVGVQIPFVYVENRLLSTEKYTLGNGKQILIKTSSKTKRINFQKDPEQVNRLLHDEQQQKALPEKTNVIKVKEIVELKPGGSEIFVQFETMNQYLELYKKKVYEIVIDSVKKQFEAFMAGFKRIINPKLIARFTAKELKLLTEGVSLISIDDMQKYTRADIDFTTASFLWSTLESLSNEDRAIFLWNWTGGDKMAAEGAKVMELRLSRARGPNFIAHTCSKHLQVPSCRTKEQMETAVTIIINNVKTGKAVIED